MPDHNGTPGPIPTPIPVLVTGVPGLDRVCGGGLPEGAVTLLTGTTGTGKSVLGAQFLAAGIRGAGEAGVFVTLEDRPEKIRRFMASFGWDVAAWEAQGSWAFFDASPSPEREIVVGEDHVDLTSLISRIAAVVTTVGAKRLVIDSISDALIRIGDRPRVRGELRRLIVSLEALGVTTIVTAERDDHGESSRFGVEQFVTDNILILRNPLEDGTRRRTLEALKFRGTPHLTGEFPYAILPNEGIVIASVAELELSHPAPSTRLSFGNADVDAMCGGGALKGSVILVSGPTGVGKSLLTVEFASAAGAVDGGRTLLVSFEESREQVFRNARGWGHDLEPLERAGKVTLLCQYPESAPTAVHLIGIQKVVDQIRPTRVVVDSLSGIERASTPRGFREFLLGLTSSLKDRSVTTLLTTTTPWLLGGPSATAVDASTLLDSIILLRYVEFRGELHRGMSVLKMRGSNHTKAIREYVITDRGLEFGSTFPAMTGILAGQPLITEDGAAGTAARGAAGTTP